MILEDSYCYLDSLASKINKNGDVAILEKSDNGAIFSRFFIAWKFSIEFFKHCRKIVYADGTFPSGPNKGTLLTSVCQDGNNQIVLMAICIVESENSAS